MVKTFLSFRLKHLARSFAFVLAVLFVIKGESSRATVPTFRRHVIDTAICAASAAPSISISQMLGFNDADVTGNDTFSILRGPYIIGGGSSSTGSVNFPGSTIVASSLSSDATFGVPSADFTAFSAGDYGIRSFTIMVSDGSGYDTVQINVHLQRNPIPDISGTFSEVHIGQSITFTGHETIADTNRTGVITTSWSMFGGSTHATVAGGVVTGTAIGNDSVQFFVSNTGCGLKHISLPITVLTNIPPAISSTTSVFSTMPGLTYSLTGTGFNATASNNIVYYGATRATVISASTTNITFTVPQGATNGPIYVLDSVTQLSTFTTPTTTISYDSTHFIPASFTSVYGAFPVDAPSLGGPVRPYSVEYADIDGDGRSDMIVVGTGSNNALVFRNQATFGQIATNSFAPPVAFPVAAGPISVRVADMDGDGKMDLVTVSTGGHGITVLRNTSTPGALSFAARQDIPGPGIIPSEIAIADYNHDGRPDVALLVDGLRDINSAPSGSFPTGYVLTTDDKTPRVVIFTNNYNRAPGVNITTSSFSVNEVYTYDIASGPISIASADFNKDGFPDLVVSNHDKRELNILRNISTAGGTPTFVLNQNISTSVGPVGTTAAGVSPSSYDRTAHVSGYPEQVKTGHLNTDDFADIAVAVSDSDLLTGNQYNKVVIVRNTTATVGGPITFGTQDTTLNTGGAAPVALTLADLSGDGKLDVVVSNAAGASIAIFRNLGAGAFTPADVHPTGALGPVCVAVGDIDGNTIHDIAVVSRASNRVVLFRGYPRADTSSIIGDTVMCQTRTQKLGTTHFQVPGTPGTLVDWFTSNGNVTLSAPTSTAGAPGTPNRDSVIATAVSTGYTTVSFRIIQLTDTIIVNKIIRVTSSVLPAPAPITGTDSLCVGSSTTLSIITTGGYWHSNTPTLATVDSLSGVVTGVGNGDATIIYVDSTPCGPVVSNYTVKVRAPLTASAITPALPVVDTVCTASTIVLSATPPAVADGRFRWRSSNPLIATVNGTGTVSGVVPGADTIYYIVTNVCRSDSSRKAIVVADTFIINTINGTSHFLCSGQQVSLTTASTGGTWSSSTGAATVNASGVVTGVGAGGLTMISYTRSGCNTVADTFSIQVNPAPVHGTLNPSATTTVCASSSITITNSGSTGTPTWRVTSGLTASGPVAGVETITTHATASVDTVFYIVSAPGCASDSTKVAIITNVAPVVSPIQATTTSDTVVCEGSTKIYTDVTTGGTWGVVDPAVASISPSGTSVVITGLSSTISGGVTNITYTLGNSCGTTTVSKSITVTPAPHANTITGATTICNGNANAITLTTTGDAGGTWSVTNGDASIGTSAIIDPATGKITGTATTPVGASPRHSVNVRYIVTNTCGSDTAYTVANTMFINTIPNASAITTVGAAGLDSICIGSSLTQTATPNSTSALGAGVTQRWTRSNTNITFSSATVPSPVITGVTAGFTTIVFIDSNMCGIDTAQRRIKVLPPTDAGTIVAPDVVCTGAPDFTLYDTLANGSIVTGGSWTTTPSFDPPIFVNSINGVAHVVHGGTVTITRTVPGTGCGSATATHVILVNPGPNAGITTGDTSLCVGTTVSLTNDQYPFGDYWYSSNDTVASVGTSGIVTGNNGGFASIFYVDSSACGADTSDALVVHVGALAPNGIIYGQDTSCIFGTAQLFDSVAGGIWTASGAATISATGLVTAGNAGGVATITYTTNNACGNHDTTAQFRVFAPPHLTSLTSATSCDSVVFNYTANWDSLGVVYGWTRDSVGGLSNTAASGGVGTITEYLDNNTNVIATTSYVFIGSKHGCADTATLAVAVSPTPHLISKLFDTVCSGAPYLYVDVESTSPANATWIRPVVLNISNGVGTGTHNISETLTNTTVPPNSVNVTYNYTLSYPGCPTHVEDLIVVVNPAPNVPHITTHSPSEVCTRTLDQNFGADSAQPAGVTYTWYATGAQVWATGLDRQYSLVNFTEPGNAVVYLIATIPGLNCPAKDSFPVTVNNSISDLPEVIYFNGDFVCLSNDQDTYQWGYDNRSTLDSSLFVGQTNQNFTVETPDFTGKLYFVITTHNGCMQKSYFNAPTGVNNVTGSMGEMKVFPNPASNIVNVEINNTPGGKYSVDVVDLLGQKLDTKSLVNDKASMDVSNLAGGVYFINCYRDGVKFASAKFIKN